jgi:hypothetical protein
MMTSFQNDHFDIETCAVCAGLVAHFDVVAFFLIGYNNYFSELNEIILVETLLRKVERERESGEIERKNSFFIFFQDKFLFSTIMINIKKYILKGLYFCVSKV